MEKKIKLTKKMFREMLNKRHQKKVEREQERLHALPKDFVQREMDRTMGNGVYHARKRKQGDYLYFQDKEMFDNLFEEEKEEFEKQLNSEKADKTCATKHVIPPKPKDSGIMSNFT